ncbi:hypothetical protein AWB64_00070 [Caballeronia sordidicola]|uniref:Uncharacterized protein n=1 Tax=Caballeronia sordidicola TaxID=196367 RepID=A0A158EPR0_CABSO|nr:hypothetical protein AWB64_00070 [Caballeronia sordidicola]
MTGRRFSFSESNSSPGFIAPYTTQVTLSRAQLSTAQIVAQLLFTPLTHELHDVGRRRTGQEARDVFEVDPTAFGYLVTRASLGAIRDFAGEHVMVLLLSTKVEEISGRLPGKPRLFLEFPKCGVREMFSSLKDPARQSPLRLTTCDQENSLTSATDNGGACLQTELPLISSRCLRCVGMSRDA